jgi:serine/threonine protein kinase
MEIDYYQKYIKYLTKYHKLKKYLQEGGMDGEENVLPKLQSLSLAQKSSERTILQPLTSNLQVTPPIEELKPVIPEMKQNRFINEGTYGCVYAPPFKCTIPCEEERCKNGIAKLMFPLNAKKELDSYRILDLASIDQEGRFHIKSPHSCEPVLPEILPPSTVGNRKCSKTKDFAEVKPRMLIFDNGGMDLYDFLKVGASNFEGTGMKYKEHILFILEKLENIFIGVTEFNMNGLFHFDIKLENIVTNIKKVDFTHRLGDKNIFKLIDFGLAEKYEDSLNPKNKFKNTYHIWPIDIIYLSDINYENKPDASMLIESRLGDMNFRNVYLFYQNYIFKTKLTDTMKEKDKFKIIYDLINERYKKHYDEETDDYSFRYKILNTVDTFGLGVVLLNIANKVPFIQDELNEFILYSGLLHPDPYRRPMAREALELYRDFLRKILRI